MNDQDYLDQFMKAAKEIEAERKRLMEARTIICSIEALPEVARIVAELNVKREAWGYEPCTVISNRYVQEGTILLFKPDMLEKAIILGPWS